MMSMKSTVFTCWRKLFILLVLAQLYIISNVICASDTPAGPCSSICTCIFAEDILIVNCSGLHLQTLPDDIPASVFVLYLSKNEIQTFTSPIMPSLKRLYLDYNGLSLIPKDARLMMQHLETLDMSHNSFVHVPEYLPAGLRSLRISHNIITEISPNNFANLTKLQELLLDNNNLTSVHRSAFGMDIKPLLLELQKLDISNNRIASIEGGSFVGVPYVAALSLMKNNLSALHRDTFAGLKNLQYLDVSHNSLRFIEQGTFRNLKVLKSLHLHHNLLTSVPRELPMIDWLDLSHNNLTHINEECKVDIYPPEILLISHNPLHCDCHMLWLKEFYDRREHVYQYTDMSPEEYLPTCSSPDELSGETWDMLGDDMFTCTAGPDSTVSYSERTLNVYNSALSTESVSAMKDFVKIRVEDISKNSIEISWSRFGESVAGDVSIQYYIFGQRYSVKTVHQSSSVNSYTITDLTPDTNYIVCILPRGSNGEVSEVNLDMCVEAKTAYPTNIVAYYTRMYSKSVLSKSFMGVPLLVVILVIIVHVMKSSKSVKANTCITKKVSNKRCRKEHND